MVLTARGAEQHSHRLRHRARLDQRRPGARHGRASRVRATAASPARATARAGASTGRRPTSCPATAASTTPPPARTWRGCGESTPTSLPGPGRSAYELLDALGTDDGPSALLVLGSNIVGQRAATPPTSRRGWRRSTCWWSCDFVMSETAAIADVVLPVTQWAEETGTMTNLEGRVVLRQTRDHAAVGRALGPRRDRRSGCAARLAGAVRDRPGGGLRRARPCVGGRAGRLLRRSPTTGSATSSGVFWRRRAAASARVVQRTPRRPGPAVRRRAPRRRGAAGRRLPGPPRRPDGCSRSTSPAPRPAASASLPDDGPFVEMHPLLAGRIGVAHGESVRVVAPGAGR